MVTVPLSSASTPKTFKKFTDFDATASVDYDRDASSAIGEDYWRVTQGFKFYFDDPLDDKWVYIPAGYLTDGASVPRMFWSLVPPWGAYGQAAILHDWLVEHLTIQVKGVDTSITRAEADKAFKIAMIALEVPRWKRNVMYIAVRVYSKWTGIKAPSINPAKARYEASETAAQTTASPSAAAAAS